ncbi:hypothetical protein H0H93_014459, partial [Arthromyces matolae]
MPALSLQDLLNPSEATAETAEDGSLTSSFIDAPPPSPTSPTDVVISRVDILPNLRYLADL